MPSSHPLPPSCHWFSRLAAARDVRSAPRLAWLLLGTVLAAGRRTVTSWIRAAGLGGEFRPCYTTMAAAGAHADAVAARLAHAVAKPLVASASRLTFALDDTPTERSGRQGERRQRIDFRYGERGEDGTIRLDSRVQGGGSVSTSWEASSFQHPTGTSVGCHGWPAGADGEGRMQFPERMAALTDGQRFRLYAMLSHHMSCQMRYIAMDAALSDSERVCRMRAVNEILHLVTARKSEVWEALPNARDWSDEEFVEWLERWATVHPEVQESLARAFARSYRAAAGSP